MEVTDVLVVRRVGLDTKGIWDLMYMYDEDRILLELSEMSSDMLLRLP
jgi:hypothetical protein